MDKYNIISLSMPPVKMIPMHSRSQVGDQYSFRLQATSHFPMWLWLWKIWFQTMGLICFLRGDPLPTSVENQGGFLVRGLTRTCAEMGRLVDSTTKVAELLYRHNEFGKLISATDSSWDNQVVYWWENMTVFVPDLESQE